MIFSALGMTTEGYQVRIAKKQKKSWRNLVFRVQDDEELVMSVPFPEVKRIVVGPFNQWFRVEINATQNWLFMPRSHERTHRFVSLLKQTMRDKIGYVEVSNRNQEIVQNLTADLYPPQTPLPKLELFFWLFQRVRPGSGARQFTTVSRAGISLMPRTLVVTTEELLLCDEDPRVPSPVFPGIVRPRVPQFVLVHRRKMSELSSIEVDSEQPNFVKLCFDEEGSSSSSSSNNDGGAWSLFSQRSLESRKLSKSLAREWRNLFQVPLTVFDVPGSANLNS